MTKQPSKQLLNRVSELEEGCKGASLAPRELTAGKSGSVDQDCMKFVRYFVDLMHQGKITDIESYRPHADAWVKKHNFYFKDDAERDSHYFIYLKVKGYFDND